MIPLEIKVRKWLFGSGWKSVDVDIHSSAELFLSRFQKISDDEYI